MEIAVQLVALDGSGTEETLMLGKAVGIAMIRQSLQQASRARIGRFCMVCRDVRGGSYEVPQLTLATPEEKKLYEIGKGVQYRFICLPLYLFILDIGFREKRRMESRTALTRVPPTSSEAEAIHSFYLKAGQYEDAYIPSSSHQPERVWMSDTTIEKSQLMFPQSRNAHSKIFGGADREPNHVYTWWNNPHSNLPLRLSDASSV
jgi:acyl-coenzyme A thioesterase 9